MRRSGVAGGPPWGDELWRRRGEPARSFGAADDWIADVERSDAFAAAFAVRAQRWYFAQSDV
jgi:hypothetical protein